MTEPMSDNDVGLAKTMLVRNAEKRRRMVLSLIYAIIFGPIAGWLVSAAWFVLYGCLQGIEAYLFSPRRARVYGLRPKAAVLMLSANGVAFGALSVAAVLNAGVWGMACGALMLAGGILYAVINNQKSKFAYAAVTTPYLLYLITITVLGAVQGGTVIQAVALALVALTLIASAHLLWCSTARRISAQSRASAEAERRRIEAETSATAKTAFVAAVSHELRTPISAILAGAEAIERDAGANPATRSNAALIAEAGEMMRALLNDLLDLSKMEAGRMSIETIDFDLRTLLARTVAFWSAEADRKGLDLTCDGIEGLPQWMAGDPTRLRQILNNLFSNAIKFTDRGAISLSVIPERRGPYWLMRFSVSDTGRGMSAQQLERLFNPFEQTQISTARTHGGTGLGLAISRELARLMGGDLDVASQEHKGSIFTLEIGLAEVDGHARPREDEMDETRALVVDDHEVNRRAVALMLEPFGVQLTAAASGVDALELLAANAFDVILMDVYMPGMDGREVCRRLRATPGPNQHTPVIACTASAEPRDLEECAQAGMTGHVIKPIDAGALHAAIAAALTPADEDQANETPRPSAGALA